MKRAFFLLILLVCLLAGGQALADHAQVTLLLGASTPVNGNKAYKKDSRAYERDLTVPVINGMEALKDSQTGASVTWFCPISAQGGDIIIDFPGSDA